MRDLSYINFRYVKNRLTEMYHHRKYPNDPWLTFHANRLLESLLRNTDIGLEFGSGRSTLWFAQRTKHLVSIEHNERWYSNVQTWLNNNNIRNVDYRLVLNNIDSYLTIYNEVKPESVDYVLVDGVFRDKSALQAVEVLRPCGMLIIDNVNRYLPSKSNSPYSVCENAEIKSEVWKEFSSKTSKWRRIWTSSGVTDTVILFKSV